MFKGQAADSEKIPLRGSPHEPMPGLQTRTEYNMALVISLNQLFWGLECS